MVEPMNNWEAESDASTLAEADVIRNDSARRIAAEKAAVDMAVKAKEKAAAMAQVGQGNLTYPPVKSSVTPAP